MGELTFDFLVRQEHNKELAKQALFERWLTHVGPSRTTEEWFGRSLLREAREWLERQNRSVPCNTALAACGPISA